VGLLVLSGLGVWAVRRRDRQPSGEQDG